MPPKYDVVYIYIYVYILIKIQFVLIKIHLLPKCLIDEE